MNAFDELYELQRKLQNNEEWLTAVENALYDKGVDSLDELIGVCIEEEDETLIYALIDEGETIIQCQDQELWNCLDEGNEEDDRW